MTMMMMSASTLAACLSLSSLSLDSRDVSRQLSNRKKIALGTQPIILSTFVAREKRASDDEKADVNMDSPTTLSVFAGGDRPTIIYSNQ